MFRKLIFTGIVATVVGVMAAPASAAGHVRHYTPSRTATLHMSHSSGVAKHHATKLTKDKKGKGKTHHAGKKKK
jgi:hypothetical protein